MRLFLAVSMLLTAWTGWAVAEEGGPTEADLALAASDAPAAEGGAPQTQDAVPDIVPRFDPVDGILWRGDQAHPVSAHEPVNGSYEHDGYFLVDEVRWGFAETAPGSNRWKANFVRARIRATAASRLLLVLNPFSKVASHSAFLWEFDEDDALTCPATGARSKGLVLTVEGRIKHGEGYSLVQGMAGKYPLVYNICTWEDYQQQCLKIYGSDLQPYVLAVSKDEAVESLRACLTEALRDHRKDLYHLTRNSCTTILVDLLFEVLILSRCPGDDLWSRLQRKRYQRKYFGGLVTNPGMSFPRVLVQQLRLRGLVEQRLPDLHHD